VVAHFDYSPEDETWTVFGDVSRGAHGLVISRLEIKPAKTSTGITGGLMRKIPTGELLGSVRAWAAVEAAKKEGTRALLGEEPIQGVFREGDEKVQQRGGRTPLTDDLLRHVAAAYLEETAPGSAPGAMRRVADRFGRPEETLRTWVTRARKDGWLGPSAKGRTGAEPGPKLLGWFRASVINPEFERKDDAALAEAFGLTAGPFKAALRAYDDISEREISFLMGIAPKLAAFASQARFGQPLSAELAERIGRLNGNEEAARAEMEQEIRGEIAERGIITSRD
jgi:transposase-like protein